MADVVQLFSELEVEELVLIEMFVSEMTDEQAQSSQGSTEPNAAAV